MEELRKEGGRPPRELTPLELAAIESASKLGWSIRKIADYTRIPKSIIFRALNGPTLRQLEHVELVFPVGIFTPASAAQVTIREGDPAVCMVTHQSGFDFLPELQPRHSDPGPETTIYDPGDLKGGL